MENSFKLLFLRTAAYDGRELWGHAAVGRCISSAMQFFARVDAGEPGWYPSSHRQVYVARGYGCILSGHVKDAAAAWNLVQAKLKESGAVYIHRMYGAIPLSRTLKKLKRWHHQREKILCPDMPTSVNWSLRCSCRNYTSQTNASYVRCWHFWSGLIHSSPMPGKRQTCCSLSKASWKNVWFFLRSCQNQ